MTIWRTSPVSQTPVLKLVQWSVFQTETGERHFVGYNVTEGEGRVSSAIVEFNPETKQGRTSSGRIYQLAGEPGFNGDAAYTWGRWCEINRVSEQRDVTEEYE